MNIDPILQDPHPALRTVCSPYTEFGAPAAALAARLVAAMSVNPRGIGLAANQIGVTQRFIVMRYGGILAMANPVIVSRSKCEQRVDDGCLSVAEGARRGTTLRAVDVFVEWQDLDGSPRRRRFRGLFAAIVQHEIDHLDGVLFVDRVVAAAA